MTSATFASLSVPAMEDSMEVSSSPAGGHFDGDIDLDIDFGDYGSSAHLIDDEHMLEDGEPARPATATDDMMHDDDQTLTAPIAEEIMQDGPDSEQLQHEFADEELIDYDDEETYQEHANVTFDEAIPANTEEVIVAQTDANHHEEPVDVDGVRESKLDAPVEQASAVLSEEKAHSDEVPHVPETEAAERPPQFEESEATSEPLGTAGTTQDLPADDTAQAVNDDALASIDAEARDEDDAAQGQQEQSIRKVPPHLPGSLDVGLDSSNDGPPTPTDTGLHPVTIKFEGYEFPLFKSRAQSDGLLKNDNLASLSLASLLLDCRQRLAIKTDETISDEQELCLGFDRLGLVLSESSRSASGTSLNDILEVYLQLHENDGTEDIPPLSLSLTRSLKFDSSFDLLKHAASQGQGMSTFSFLDPGQHDDLHDEVDHADDHIDETTYHDADENHTGEDQDFAQDQDTHTYDDQDQEQDSLGGHHNQDGEYHDGEYPEDQFGDFDHDEEFPDPEDFDQEAQEPAAEAETAAGEGSEGVEKTRAPESAASSATVRNDDIANEVTETYADEGAEDFSTLLNENAADASEAGGTFDEHPEHLSHSTDHEEADNDQSPTYEDHLATVDPGSEDLLQYDQPEDEVEPEAADFFNEAGGELDHYDQNNPDEADNLVYDDHDESQLGEDGEQFHAVNDLYEGNPAEFPDPDGDTAQTPQDTNEDDINFDDDVDFGDNQPGAQAATSNSPLGKRSYEDHVEDDEFDFGEPDAKKSRSD